MAIRLKLDRYHELCRQHGLTTYRQQGSHLGLDHTAVYRVVRGDYQPGGLFVSAALKAFGVSFEDLFETEEAKAS